MGQIVGSYEILHPLGSGGMAQVSVAVHRALGRTVALKQLSLRSEAPDAAARFIRESRIVASLAHPRIVVVHDFFEHDGLPCIAMELLPGGSLRPHIEGMTSPQALGVLADVLEALTYTETRHIVHRDIKPDNVLLTADGRVKLADFGIAKAIGGAPAPLTATGIAVGTPQYMAPEQATAGPVGPCTDLYAVGMMAFHLLVGRTAFEDESPMGLLFRQVNEIPPRVDAVDPGGDRELADWVEWLVRKEPVERPQSAADAWDELAPIAERLCGAGWRERATLPSRTEIEPPTYETFPGARAERRPGPPVAPPEPVAMTAEPVSPGAAPTVAPSHRPLLEPEATVRPPRRALLALAALGVVLALVGALTAPGLLIAGALLASGAGMAAALPERRARVDDGSIRPTDRLT